MKLHRKKKLVISVWVVIVLAIGFMGPTNLQAKEVTLSWVSFLPKSHPETKDVQTYFVDKINARTKGKFVLNYRGGPEVMAPTDVGTAVQKGIIDMATTLVGYYEAIVPGVGGLMLTELSPDEERQTPGLMEYIQKIHSEKGLVYIGRSAPSYDPYFYFFLNKKVTEPEDFKKLKLGTATALRAAAVAWGASVTPVKLSDYFTAMERNMVDGIPGCAIEVWVALGCHQKTKYVLDHQFYRSTATMIMNQKSWNKIPADVQKIFQEELINYQKKKMDLLAERNIHSREKMKEAGVEFYKMSPENAKWLEDTAVKAAWEYQYKRFPEVTETLQKFITK